MRTNLVLRSECYGSGGLACLHWLERWGQETSWILKEGERAPLAASPLRTAMKGAKIVCCSCIISQIAHTGCQSGSFGKSCCWDDIDIAVFLWGMAWHRTCLNKPWGQDPVCLNISPIEFSWLRLVHRETRNRILCRFPTLSERI